MIRLQNVHKSYGTLEKKVPVLTDINLKIERGEFISIMGPSGSGKSTLMNLLGLLDRPSSGHYFFEHQEISEFQNEQLAKLRNESVGFIFQDFLLLPKMNLIDNVALPLLYQQVSQPERVARSKAMLASVGLKELVNRKPSELSGGQQQRAAVARALITKPKIILADEPTGALDSITGQEIFNLLKGLNKQEKTTIIVVTHDQNIASQCQKIIRLEDGKILK